jgi:LmeA-like phospholipid-binding
MLIDYLMSKDGLRIEAVDVSIRGVRLTRDASGFVPQSATEMTGTLRVTLADLSAAVARPEVIDLLLAGVPGIARPEISFVNDDDGGIRIVGSVEAMGRRIPVTASTRIRIANSRLIVSPVRIQGLPFISALPMQLPDLELPLGLPLGLQFTGVTTEPGSLILRFAGSDLDLAGRRPAEDAPDGTPKG